MIEHDPSIAANEAEARAMVARTGHAVQTEGDGRELTEDALVHVTGGAAGDGGIYIGDKVSVNGPLYLSSDGELSCGTLTGVFFIQRCMPNRPKPYLLKNNVGWVGAESVTPVES